MSFAKTTVRLVGQPLQVNPEIGFGWVLVGEDRIVEEIPMLEAFRVKLDDVLFEATEARAVLSAINLEIAHCQFSWACFIPRTTSKINLQRQSVGCNVFFSAAKPYLSSNATYPDPDQIRSESKIHIRGYARISLLKVK